MRCATVFLDPGLPVALELLLPRFGLLMSVPLKSDETLKTFVLSHKVAPGDDVVNLVCATGAAGARFAPGLRKSGPHCQPCAELCMLVSFVTGSATGNYFVLGSTLCKLCSRK